MMMAYIMCHVIVENTHFMRMYVEYIYINTCTCMIVYWDTPPPGNRGKLRLWGSSTKNVIILVVTGFGSIPDYMICDISVLQLNFQN